AALPATWLFRDGLGAAFGRIAAVARRAGARGSHEQLAAVGEGDVAPVGALQRVVLRLVAVDDDLGAVGQRVFRDAAAQQGVRRAALDHPLLGLAVLDDLDVNPRMRVHPLEADDLALETNRGIRVELGAKGMMRENGAAGDREAR